MSETYAVLPMYDWPELSEATDQFWRAAAEALRARGVSAPAQLSRGRLASEIWREPSLTLGQSCGADYVAELEDFVELIAAPVYDAPGCHGAQYSSIVITQRGADLEGPEQLRNAVAAVNSFGSFSGWWALRDAEAAPPTAQVMLTGAHRRSALAVASGEVDFAAIDAVAYAHFRRFEPAAAAELKTVTWTALRSAPPFITSRARVAETRVFQDALREAIQQAPDAASELLLTDIAPVTSASYQDFKRLAPKDC